MTSYRHSRPNADKATAGNGELRLDGLEGQTYAPKIDTHGLQLRTAFQSSSARCMLLFKNSNNLKYHGYFAGGQSPQLVINYTK